LPPSHDTFSLLHDETLRLAQLVEDVLQLARADVAQENLRLEQVDARELIDNALATFAPRFTEKSVTLNIHFPEEPVLALMDTAKIGRVLRNLTDNAALYSPEGEVVEVGVMQGPHMVRVEYANKAKDLRADDLPHLFERFYRGEKSRSRQHGGAGIGLAIVKELVEAHGGIVGAEMKGEKIHIWFELPLKMHSERIPFCLQKG